MKSYSEREKQMVREGVEVKGSQAELGRYLGMTRQQVHDLLSGKCRLTGEQLLKLADLLKKVACVLLAVAATAQAPESGAIGLDSELSRTAIARQTTDCKSNRRAGVADSWTRRLWRWLIGEFHPGPLCADL